jgi:hypothetical protein
MFSKRMYRFLLLAVALVFLGPAGVGARNNVEFNHDIVAVDLAGRQTNLTRNHPAFDGSPAVARDGRIVFVSTRGGNPDLYVMNGDGRNVRRLTNSASDGSGVAWDEALNLTEASWSPRGDRIAFDGRYMERGPPLPATLCELARSRRRVERRWVERDCAQCQGSRLVAGRPSSRVQERYESGGANGDDRTRRRLAAY